MSSDWDSNFCREMCDKCQKRKPVRPDGAMITIVDARRLRGFRPQAKRALKVYNKSNSKRFKLENIYKVNFIGGRYQYITFSAQAAESFGRTLFLGVVHGDDKVVFCEVKEDDKIKLPFYLFDSLSSPPRLRRRKNDIGDGSKGNSDGAKHGEITGTTAAGRFMNFPPQA